MSHENVATQFNVIGLRASKAFLAAVRLLTNRDVEHSGDWKQVEYKGFHFMVPIVPEGQKVLLRCPGVFRGVHDSAREVHASARDVGAAVFYVAVNHAGWALHEAGLFEQAKAMSDCFHRIQDAFFDDDSELDAEVIFTYAD